jgi:hypothetical protein
MAFFMWATSMSVNMGRISDSKLNLPPVYNLSKYCP